MDVCIVGCVDEGALVDLDDRKDQAEKDNSEHKKDEQESQLADMRDRSFLRIGLCLRGLIRRAAPGHNSEPVLGLDASF